MKEDIISQKLRRELSNLPIDTEPQVMYLLVEIRKVFEHENERNNLLCFYGDWVVHTKLDRAWARKVLSQIKDEENPAGMQIVSFRKLKSELKAFLENRSLPTDLVDSSDYWIPFRECLIDILVDTPIQESTKSGEVLGSFSFQRRNHTDIEYSYYFKDDRNGLGKVIVD